MISLLERTENRVGEVKVSTTNDEYDGLNRLYKREINSFGQALGTFVTSAAISFVSAGVSQLAQKGMAKMKYNRIVGNSTQNIQINKKLADAGYGSLKIGRDGQAAVLKAISKSQSIQFVRELISNGLGYTSSVLLDLF